MDSSDSTFPERTGGSYAGILLAAGRGRRFDPSGAQSKLLQRLPDGEAVAVRAAKNLRAATAAMLAVVPPGAPVLAAELAAAGIAVSECGDADLGMAASLTHGLRASADADGWVIALGDMPFVRPDTIARLLQALAQGAQIAVPVQGGRRGNPVAFGRAHLARLLQLTGDTGARKLLQAYPVCEVAVDDAGIHRDIDTPEDLRAAADWQD